MIASSSARTSQTEAANIIQLLSPESFKKAAEAAFKNRKPILISYTKEELPYEEAALLSRATKIFSNPELDLYELPFDSLFYYSGPHEIESYENMQLQLFRKNNFQLKDTSQFFFAKSFDENSSEKIFSGHGAFQGRMNDLNFLLPDTALGLDTGVY